MVTSKLWKHDCHSPTKSDYMLHYLHSEVNEHLTAVDSALGVLRASMDQQSPNTNVQSTVRLSND